MTASPSEQSALVSQLEIVCGLLPNLTSSVPDIFSNRLSGNFLPSSKPLAALYKFNNCNSCCAAAQTLSHICICCSYCVSNLTFCSLYIFNNFSPPEIKLVLLHSLGPVFTSIGYCPSSSTLICCIGDTAVVGKKPHQLFANRVESRFAGH